MKKIIVSLCLFISAVFTIAHAAEVKVAAVEFNPAPKDVDGNIFAVQMGCFDVIQVLIGLFRLVKIFSIADYSLGI